MMSAPASAKASRKLSTGEIIRWTSNGLALCGRSAFTTAGPIVRLGTKWPSITSIWIQSAPAASIARTSSPSRAKSADRIEGEMSGRVMAADLPLFAAADKVRREEAVEPALVLDHPGQDAQAGPWHLASRRRRSARRARCDSRGARRGKRRSGARLPRARASRRHRPGSRRAAPSRRRGAASSAWKAAIWTMISGRAR